MRLLTWACSVFGSDPEASPSEAGFESIVIVPNAASEDGLTQGPLIALDESQAGLRQAVTAAMPKAAA